MIEITPGVVWPEPPHFPVGRAVMDYGAAELLDMKAVSEALGRHERADWGEVSPEARKGNDQALSQGRSVESAWTDPYGTRFTVTTSGDRSYTRVFLAEMP